MVLLPIHILAGAIAIVAGYVALSAAKGGTLHRKAGTIFVHAMMVMSALGALMAIVKLNRGNIMAGTLTFYMVTTALLTTRRHLARIGLLDRAAMLLGLAVGAVGYVFGFLAAQSPTGMLDRYPAPLFFTFGTIALLSAAGDIRLVVRGGLQGKQRIVRHVWRMCFATFIATGSFFLGQAKVIPKPMRIFPVLYTLALLPMAFLIYWVVRVKFTQWWPRRDRVTASKPRLPRVDTLHALESES